MALATSVFYKRCSERPKHLRDALRVTLKFDSQKELWNLRDALRVDTIVGTPYSVCSKCFVFNLILLNFLVWFLTGVEFFNYIKNLLFFSVFTLVNTITKFTQWGCIWLWRRFDLFAASWLRDCIKNNFPLWILILIATAIICRTR